MAGFFLAIIFVGLVVIMMLFIALALLLKILFIVFGCESPRDTKETNKEDPM